MTYPTDDLGNVAVDYVWGNLPIQPNDARPGMAGEWLGDGDSHNIAATQYNDFPGYQENVRTTYIDSDPLYNTPANGFWDSNSNQYNCATRDSHIEFLRTVGVDPSILKDFTFSGGETEWDATGEPNFDGVVFYLYVPEGEVIDFDQNLGYILTGADLDGKVAYTFNTYTSEDVLAPWSAHTFVVFTTNPLKNNWGWF